ncbi:O-methyltransferase, family 3 [Cordyceps fumosorosea ARSEF 2679]|uniref:O-methyltransferase, family 3 n=1 Tax=Cordyceps fumosorosea (strain ARSEF 2679) TaxID=1081104 RepID=A0A167N6K2_CORFA|nr:O-methyltransferase, family 3 [Cordyceps fumosorosea ARSEF 2679]OAA55189.1 O-methyltransferase, family 3 [Cordyceps fumosorosea ARSEF 2679]
MSSPMPLSTKIAHITAIEAGAEKAFVKPDPHLDNAVASTARHGMPAIQVSPLQGQLLAIQARLVGAKTVLEVGALGGYSTICLARTGARVTSVEIDAKHRDVARENLAAAGLEADFILGDAKDVLPRLVSEGRVFDMVFIDADWGVHAEYFGWAVQLTRKNGCIFVDNVVQELITCHGGDVGEGTLVARIGKESNVTATLVPKINGKEGVVDNALIDGFVLAIVH